MGTQAVATSVLAVAISNKLCKAQHVLSSLVSLDSPDRLVARS